MKTRTIGVEFIVVDGHGVEVHRGPDRREAAQKAARITHDGGWCELKRLETVELLSSIRVYNPKVDGSVSLS